MQIHVALESGGMWKVVIMAFFNVLCRNLTAGNEANHVNVQL